MPESPINTYDLLSKSDFIITFGSTIGVEASYFCKPSILASNAFHENLQIVKRVHTMQDIVDILNSKPNSSQLRSSYENALKYGLFYSNGGIHFRFLKKADLKEQDPSFAFENVRIGSWRIISFIRMIEGKFFDFLAPILPSGCNCNLP
jgi:CDP-glycerol glycerophosphotransferase (TagB/SpsB family)